VDVAEGPDESAVVGLITDCPVGQWCIESPAFATTAPLLHAVWAASADDVFAVGDAGTILRRVNGDWVVLDSGTTTDLRGLWGTSASDVWATGVDGTILHFDGTQWATIPGGGTSDIDAVWGSSATDVWFAGSSRALRWNGSAFTSFPLSGTLLSVSGTGPNDVWVSGENSYLRRFNGAFWSTINPGAGTASFVAVLALATNDVWATDVTSLKETIHFTGGKWAGKPTGGAIFTSLSALGPSDIWAVGQKNIGHWNGTAWTVEQPFGSVQMWAISATPGHAWVVGDGALIAHRVL
jgi:hypothetical protein